MLLITVNYLRSHNHHHVCPPQNFSISLSSVNLDSHFIYRCSHHKHEKQKRSLFKIAIIALLFFTNPFIIRKCIAWYETKPVSMSTLSKYNAGILLGGMVSYNRYDDQGYFNPAADRFIETALLYKTGHINNIIIAAGNG